MNFFLVLLVTLSFNASVEAFEGLTDLHEKLQKFHQDPYHEMNQRPDEVREGRLISQGPINYLDVEKTVLEKSRIRSQIISQGQAHQLFSVIQLGDDPFALVENGDVQRNIVALDQASLGRSFLSVSPWVDSYWPIYKGIIAIRYADPQFPNSKAWIDNYNYILANPVTSVLRTGDSRQINRLSPAEKYDLLVGDSNMTLTKYSWSKGEEYYQKYGFVETWMGICHGWAGAAHMLVPNIDAPLVLPTPQGQRLTFYQSDIKALNSMLWANANLNTRFVGAKCRVGNPAKSPIGRVIEPACLDNNPATFHLSLLNQIGRYQRSFVMDSTYDAQIWNFAIVGYDSVYFNPQSLRPTHSLREGIIPIEKYTLDKFKEFRSPEARYVVGVAMDVSHSKAMTPTQKTQTLSPAKVVRFLYDLELDENYNIIGGEWYMNAHPDFIWTYDQSSIAKARVDRELNPAEWQIGQPVPASWTDAARRASSMGTPLYSVISSIIQMSPEPATPVEDHEAPPTEDTPPES